jgi:type II secretory pathway pseudopilin PulG
MIVNTHCNERKGFSLIEVVCMLVILSVLVGMFMPAIQSVRESSRELICRNNLRQIGLAALNYESSLQKLPPGNLGFTDVIVARNDFSDRWRDDTEFEYYWKKAQHSSAFTFLLPYLDEANRFESLPSIFFSSRLYGDHENLPHSWIGEWSEVEAAMQTPLPFLFCPTDDLLAGIGEATPIIGAQPVYFTNSRLDGLLDGYLAVIGTNRSYQSSNYLGCAGAFSGGRVPDRSLSRFRGAMGCRDATRMADIMDGNSNTIVFAETLGAIRDSKRTAAYVWTFGSLGRGRGGLPWGKTHDPRIPNRVLLGDWLDSSLAGFGSKHPWTINAVNADGSVRAVRRDVELRVWYALCGMADGG